MRKIILKNYDAKQIIRQKIEEDLNNGNELYQFLFKFVRSRINDFHEAEDIANAALFNMWKKADTYNIHEYPIDTSIPILKNKSFRNWGGVVVKNAVVDSIRERSRFRKMNVPYSDYSSENGLALEESAVLNEDPISLIIKSEEIKRVKKIIPKLSSRLRNVTEMHYYDRKKYREIAKELNIPMGTVKSRLSKAKGKLKEILLSVNN